MLHGAFEARLLRALTRGADTRGFPLVLTAISLLPDAGVILTPWMGKLVRYMFNVWLASAFSLPLIRRIQDRMVILRAALSRPQSLGSGFTHEAVPEISLPRLVDR